MEWLVGRGTIKIMDACKTAGLKAPYWTTSEISVKLSFPLNVKLGGAIDGAHDGAKDDKLIFKLGGAIDGAHDGAKDDKLIFKLDGAIDGAIDGATKATKRKLSVLLKAIVSNEGKRTPDYKEITKLGSERTMERYIEQLKEVRFIEFKGTAAQTGGYFITDKLKKIISS